MFTLNKKVLAAMFVVLLALAVVSCKKKSEGGLVDLQSEADNSLMEDENSSIFNFVDFTGENDGGTNGPTPPGMPGITHILPLCADWNVEILDTITGWPRKLTIWFDNDADTTNGFGDCTCRDGIKRHGKIIVIFLGKHKTPGLIFKIQLWRYFAKDIGHEGERTFEWIDDTTVHISASGIKVKFPDGTGTFSFDKYIRRVTCPTGVNDTATFRDDAYEMWGTVDGTNRKGKHYTIRTTQNVVRSSYNCCTKMTLVSGVVEITTDGIATRTIDFGDGTCDTQAIVTIDGKQYFVQWR